jgi:hypothetical protein
MKAIAAAEAMRRILIERARAKSRLRRGSRGRQTPPVSSAARASGAGGYGWRNR